MTLQKLRADYLRHVDAGGARADIPRRTGAWDGTKLHLSDLGYCPRKVAYRMLKAPVEKTPEQADNEQIMFALGYYVHYLTYEALRWQQRLVQYECPLPCPDGWSGTMDALFTDEDGKLVLYDCKTTRSNAFRYAGSFPKPENVLQIQAYFQYAGESIQRTIIEYVDRGGANTPVECIIPADNNGNVEAAMAVLESARDNLPDLPDVLPLQVIVGYSNADGMPNKLSWGRSWQCGFCDYAHLCEPLLPLADEKRGYQTVSLAARKDNRWELTKRGEQDYSLIAEYVG